MTEGLRLDVRERGEAGNVLAVAGEVDMSTAPQLLQCLVGLAGADVVVDLAAVTYLDSAGLAALVAGYRAAEDSGHTVRTVNEQDIVRTVMETTGLYPMFHDGAPPGEV